MNGELACSVSEFVALLNQTLEFAYPNVTIVGELANFKVSKGRWVYFDLKDDEATVRFFGTVYQLPGPLEDGMLLAVKGQPRLHQQYGFSVNVISMQPTGEGSIKKAATLLAAKLEAEGLFDAARKRALPYPPRTIGLITSAESAAYRDFIKVLGHRWGGMHITLIDVAVQGETAPAQLSAAIEQFNQQSVPPDVVVITRGGGSAEDLRAFSTEQVVRAVAGSRIPTLVAIGHETDLSLAELAADVRASTPSNAAELLAPDRRAFTANVHAYRKQLGQAARGRVAAAQKELTECLHSLHDSAAKAAATARQRLGTQQRLLAAFDPQRALQRGYAVVRTGAVVGRAAGLQAGDAVVLEFADGHAGATITDVTMKEHHGKNERLPKP